jgi:glycolate oxidase FAD binding subunit
VRRGPRPLPAASARGRRAGGAVLSVRPSTPEEAAALLRTLAQEGRAVAPRGGGTKPWGPPVDGTPLETGGLDRILEHNVGDFTAVLEAGVRLADAQAAFAAEGQMLALDPPLGAGDGATVGGLVATADSGPLRHRFGGVRDLVVGISVVLSDGTQAKAGGRVIKNVAGYDLSKLFAGSFGTLGLISTVSVRLHPLPSATATARAASDDPDALARAAAGLAGLPLEADALDVAWAQGRGAVLVRFGGAAAGEQAEQVASRLREAGLGEADVVDDDDALWAAQRARQRAPEGVVLKVSGVIADLATVLRAAEAERGTVVSRAGLGLSWVALEGGDLGGRADRVRRALDGRTVTALDGAAHVSAPWPEPDRGALAVMERIKARFDPAGVFRPGAFVGGL